MADRISSLEAEKLALESLIAGQGNNNNRSKSPSLQPGEAAANDPGVAQLRLELAEALRSRGVAETRLRTAEEELDKLRSKTKQDIRSLKDLTTERTSLATKVNDREYELKEKRKLVEVLLCLNLLYSKNPFPSYLRVITNVYTASPRRDDCAQSTALHG